MSVYQLDIMDENGNTYIIAIFLITKKIHADFELAIS